MRVSLFVTCVVELFTPEVGVAAVKVLRAAGCTVDCPAGQVCCGQPAWNSGYADEAAAVARTSLTALEADPSATVVVPAGSCATMIRVFWPELFEVVGDPAAAERARLVGARTREFTELVAERADRLPPLALAAPTPVAYHHSCHMLRELDLDGPPLALLDRVGGCQRVEWEADRRCCGFGGLFSFRLPETSVAMADDKLVSLAAAEPAPAVVVGADGSCLAHLRTRAEHEGGVLPTRHVAEVLAEALGR